MKKKIIILLLVVVLAIGGLSGGVYAKNKDNKGEKLVGLGSLGVLQFGDIEKDQYNSGFYFTNPDCVNSIEITKVSIIGGNGTVIYDGPYISVWIVAGEITREVIDRPMEPHEVWMIWLFNYMYQGGDLTNPNSWLDFPTAFNQPLQSYTVEIFWKSAGKGNTCPLVGFWTTQITQTDPVTGQRTGLLQTENQMVNMTQK